MSRHVAVQGRWPHPKAGLEVDARDDLLGSAVRQTAAERCDEEQPPHPGVTFCLISCQSEDRSAPSRAAVVDLVA